MEQLEQRVVPSASIIRIVTYNIEADIDGVTTPRSGLYQVLEGIGEEKVQGHVQPPDIIALEETTSNSTTVAPIVSNLNAFYGTLADYAQSSYQATQSGSNSDGNGPNALVYNTKTLTLLASVGVGTPEGSTNGEYRQVVRYEFQPAGETGAVGIFYVYVAHSKSGSTSADATDRYEEAQIIRNDEATLPANAAVIYAGDFNLDASSDQSYQTLTAVDSPGGVAQGQGFDPINMPGSWDTNSQFQGIMTESATDLRYRDDVELVTSNIMNQTAGSITYVAGSYHSFGNNGTTPVYGSVDSGSDTALNSDLVQDGPSFITASTLYSDLTTASDHLPVVADYTVPSATTQTTLTDGGPNPSQVGQAVSFTVAVTGFTGSVANETVSIEDASNANTVVGSGTLNSNGQASISITTLAAGVHKLFAVYSGDSVNTGSVSSQVAQTVNANPITVSSVNVDAGTAPVISASESGSTATITTDGPNGFSAGDPVVLADIGSGYDGTYTIASVPTTRTFTVNFGANTGLPTVNSSGTATDTALTDSGLLVNGTAGNGYSASYNSQRSLVDSIAYTFNQAVTIGSGGFTIAVQSAGNAGGTAPSLAWASANGGTTWVVTFSGAGVVGNSIANGAYAITLNNSAVSAVSGGGTLASSETDTFFRLYGDSNGDARVNSTDYSAFNPAYNTQSSAATFLALFDVNGDGRINSTDYGYVNADYNVRYTGFSRTI